MQTIKHLILAAVLFTAPSTAFAGAYHDLAREPHGIEVPVPEPAPAPAAPAAKKITIYTAKTIVTEDPGTPTAEAVAVMDGKILGVGTLDEVKDWVTDEQVEIDQRFKDAVIVPGLIEAHMHPQITGILWQGVYVGRFDRTAPDGTLVNGLDTKEAVVERLKDAAAKLPADGRWLVGWGYQPEFYGDSPLTRADLDPSFGGVKFVVDGSIQGYTGLFQWPGYYKTFANGIANISQDDLTKWVTEVHKRGFQAVIHTNADEATEMALTALTEAERQYPQLATRHRLEHNQYVTQSQLLRMKELGLATNLFTNHIYYWGDLHYSTFTGPESLRDRRESRIRYRKIAPAVRFGAQDRSWRNSVAPELFDLRRGQAGDVLSRKVFNADFGRLRLGVLELRLRDPLNRWGVGLSLYRGPAR